ncbi:hypothetical protein G9A89_008482 [Geosiphon pyriformis]|nr:hypothetical protein G9A89_008482 [Geosiphon pyriformis]
MYLCCLEICSSTSSIQNEGAFPVIKESLAIFPANEYSKVADLVKIHLVHNQQTPENLFNYLKNKSSKRSIDHILLGFSLEHGIGTIPNLTKVFLEYQKAANTKDSLGQFFLGRCYDNGTEKAFELYLKAAEAGHLKAQYNFALCYANGEGTIKNLEKAFELYSKAAEAEHLDAQYNLALCYANRRGMIKNERKAFKLYSKAAEAGSLLGHIPLREYCLNEQETIKDQQNEWGIVKNLEETFQFFLKTAEAGNQNAKYNLGWWYQSGWGTTRNLEKAFELYLKAAEANNFCFHSDFPDLNVHDLNLVDKTIWNITFYDSKIEALNI